MINFVKFGVLKLAVVVFFFFHVSFPNHYWKKEIDESSHLLSATKKLKSNQTAECNHRTVTPPDKPDILFEDKQKEKKTHQGLYNCAISFSTLPGNCAV